MIISPGSTARIVWTFDDNIQSGINQFWIFSPPNGTFITLASAFGNGPVVPNRGLYDFEAKKPATLILKNVNETYNGKYKFQLAPSTGLGEDEVTVLIAGKL